MSDLQERLLAAIHDPGLDIELLVHEVAGSDDAQVYLVELMETLATISPASPSVRRAAAILEQSVAIAAEHEHVAVATQSAELGATKERGPGDGRGR